MKVRLLRFMMLILAVLISATGVLAADCAEFIMCKGINKTVYVHLTQITTRTVTIKNAWICNYYDRDV